jgi:hypothetical protein
MNKEPDKTKRPDRSLKLKARKDFKETIVKCSLLKYLEGTSEHKNAIILQIKNRVKAYSERINIASLSLSEIVKTKFDNNINVINVDIKNIFELTFIRQLLLGTDGVFKEYEDINNLWNSDSPLATYLRDTEIKRYNGDRNIYSSGAQIYLTNFKNSLVTNLETRIKRFLKVFQSIFNLSNDERVFMLYKIFGWKLPNDINDVTDKQHILHHIDTHRTILNLENGEQINKDYLRKSANLENILKYYVHLNRFYVLYGLKTFNIVPICRIKSHYITIDSSVLFGILKDVEFIDKSITGKTFQTLAMDYWQSIIKVNKLAGSNCRFTKTINTDGICMCVHFQRPKVCKNEDDTVQFTKEDRVVAVDPGRVNIFYGVEKLDNGNIKEHVLTRKQYYNDSGINNANQQVKQWTKSIQGELKVLSKVSTKGMSINKHHKYIETYLTVKKDLWDEYLKPRWSRQRFRLYCGKKRVFARFFNSIDDFDKTREVKLAYGSAKFDPTGKGEVSVPTSRLFNECVYHFKARNIKLIDEFLTTKIHCDTDTVLQKVNIKGAKDSLRGLLWCNSPTVSKFVSRDRNAALNILRCAMSTKRPKSLERRNERTIVIIGKYIKDCSKSHND